MSSLFRSLSGVSTKRETAVKEAILEALQENVKEIEYEAKDKGNTQPKFQGQIETKLLPLRSSD